MVVDRAVFSLVNLRQSVTVGADKLLLPESRKKLAGAVLERLGGMINLQGKQCSLQEAISLQAQSIRDCLLDANRYHPFLARR